MDYMLLFLFGPFIILGSVILVRVLIKLGAIPTGIPFLLSLATVTSIVCGALSLALTIETHIYQPARVQQGFLGRRYASVLALRSYQDWGFQDPGQRWRYTLDPATAAELRRRCRWVVRPFGRDCSLFSTMDERYYGFASLDGDTLTIESGLW